MTNEVFAQRIIAMQGALYRVSASILSQECDREDAVQSCIERAWRKQSTLKDESRMQAWVTRILINECYAIIRRRKHEMPVESVPDLPAPPGSDPDLYRFFTALPDKLRLPMVLFYLEGYNVREISGMLRLPAGTVKSRLSRGRDAMKKNEIFKEVQDL